MSFSAWACEEVCGSCRRAKCCCIRLLEKLYCVGFRVKIAIHPLSATKKEKAQAALVCLVYYEPLWVKSRNLSDEENTYTERTQRALGGGEAPY